MATAEYKLRTAFSGGFNGLAQFAGLLDAPKSSAPSWPRVFTAEDDHNDRLSYQKLSDEDCRWMNGSGMQPNWLFMELRKRLNNTRKA